MSFIAFAFAGLHPTGSASARPISPPAALQSHWRAGLRDGPWVQPEPAPPGPLPDPHRRRRGARVPAGAGGRPVRHGRPRGAAAGDELLQLVHLRRVLGRLRRPGARRVGGEPKRMGYRLHPVRSVRAAGDAHMDGRLPFLQEPAARWKRDHKNLAGIRACLFIQIQDYNSFLVMMAIRPNTWHGTGSCGGIQEKKRSIA